jgi:hypothetical protein
MSWGPFADETRLKAKQLLIGMQSCRVIINAYMLQFLSGFF